MKTGLVQSKAARDRAVAALSAAKTPKDRKRALAACEAAVREIAKCNARLEARRGPATAPPVLRVKPAATAPTPKPEASKWITVYGFAGGVETTSLEADDDDLDEEDEALDLDPDGDDDDEDVRAPRPGKQEKSMDPSKNQQDAATANMIEARVRATMPKTDATAFRPIPEPRGLEASAEELAEATAAMEATKARALAPKRGSR